MVARRKELTEQERAGIEKRKCDRESYDENPLLGFASKMMPYVMSCPGNVCFSPVGAYLSLGMLAMGASGRHRSALLALLGQESVEELEETMLLLDSLLNDKRRYVDTTCASSFWCDASKGYSINEHYMDMLERTGTKASELAFEGQISDAISAWAHDASEGFLNVSLDVPDDAAAVIANIIRFKGIWSDEFDERNTKEGTFHAEGKDVEAPFMHAGGEGYAVHDDSYTAGFRSIGSADMAFFLPRADKGLESLATDEATAAEMFSSSKRAERAIVQWSMPKFDVHQEIDVKEMLHEMGFDDETSVVADLSGMLDGPYADNGTEVEFSQHSRIAVDEKGVEAAALSIDHWACLDMLPAERVGMTLDRPFAFTLSESLYIEGEDNKSIPLFIGKIEDPTK